MIKPFFLCFALMLSQWSIAQIDTISVKAYDHVDLTWNKDYNATAIFPSTNSYEKIIMDFTMGCATGGCSHWDYTISIALNKSTGIMDSVAIFDTLSFHPLQIDTLWNRFEVMEKFELGRLVTPYGNYMHWDRVNDPNDIFESNWEHSYQFDVTDFAPLLHDSVLLSVHYGGWSSGFSATIDFNFIPGVAPREVLSIENLHKVGSFTYKNLADDIDCPAITKYLNEDVKGLAVKTYISGHGHEGPDNCCEWISKRHNLSLNRAEVFSWNVWKDCGQNPIYPQGGTWPFDRAGWCPGTKVDMQVSELTPYLSFKEPIELDYGVEAYTDNGEADGSFIVSNTLFTYGAINLEYDAELIQIIKPSENSDWSRINPICSNPVVELRNRGGKSLTSAHIKYGIEGQELLTYIWSGNLKFLEKSRVELPMLNCLDVEISDTTNFVATVIAENDEYESNNSLSTKIIVPEILPSSFVFEFLTQSDFEGVDRAIQNSYIIYDSMGEVVFERSNELNASTLYSDTLSLPSGCYELIFKDSAEDGMNEHWYSGEASTNAGEIKIKTKEGELIKQFPDDFGQQINYLFSVE